MLKFTAINAFKPKWRVGVIRIGLLGSGLLALVWFEVFLLLVDTFAAHIFGVSLAALLLLLDSLLPPNTPNVTVLATDFSNANGSSPSFNHRKRIFRLFYHRKRSAPSPFPIPLHHLLSLSQTSFDWIIKRHGIAHHRILHSRSGIIINRRAAVFILTSL